MEFMKILEVKGGVPLEGKIRAQGAKKCNNKNC